MDATQKGCNWASLNATDLSKRVNLVYNISSRVGGWVGDWVVLDHLRIQQTQPKLRLSWGFG